MGTLKWYKRFPHRSLVGMSKLTLEERGAYNTVLDLIYINDGGMEDDDRVIAGHMAVDVRVWRRLRARLLSIGKLYVYNGTLRNETADREVDVALHRVACAVRAGLQSALNRGYGVKDINGMQATTVERALERTKNNKERSLSAKVVPLSGNQEKKFE